MNPALWRVITLAYGVMLLALAAANAYAGFFANATPGFTARYESTFPKGVTVLGVTERAAISGSIHPGDRVHLVDNSFVNRVRFTRERPGEQFDFAGTTPDGRATAFRVTMRQLGPAGPDFWSFEAMGIVFIAVGAIIAMRRPADPVVRRLVGLFLAIATIIVSTSQPWMSIFILMAALAAHLFCQPLAAYAALALAVVFPKPSAGGFRRWLDVANPWLLGLCLVTLYGGVALPIALLRSSPLWLQTLGIVETVIYYAAIVAAFVIARRGLSGADSKRLQWVAWTLAAGFSGEIVLVAMFVFGGHLPSWAAWLNLTLLAIPFGLGYAIVRHRVVDIGFVVNRALVFAILSAIVVLAFMILEWALSTFFVKVSHITSTSLELALAVALGFSLRTIHANVDRFVDDFFFRDRHAAERALRTFAREVAYIADPRTAIARAHADLVERTGAASAAIYLVDGLHAVRVDPAKSAAPDRIDIDDAALVRMRTTRSPLDLRTVRSALAGEYAFPMCVRDAVSGLVVLGAKSSGEAFAPDEIASVEAVVLALGNALDALQTAALKAEIARLLIDGAPIDSLRRTADPAAWVRGVVPQPAGSLRGFGE